MKRTAQTDQLDSKPRLNSSVAALIFEEGFAD
jgi:hypothetical protein